jgi:hypothetical protein
VKNNDAERLRELVGAGVCGGVGRLSEPEIGSEISKTVDKEKREDSLAL